MTGPQDPAEAGGGRLRAGHADREQVIETLKDAFVQGRLTRDEFDQRLGQTFASRTYAELDAVTADLSAGPAAAQPPQPAQAGGEARIPRPGRVLTVATVLYAAAWPVALALPVSGPEHESPAGLGLLFWSSFVYLIVLLFAGAQLLADRQDKRSGRQPGSTLRASF